MKPAGILLIALAVGFIAYQFVYPPLAGMLGLEKPKPVVAVVEEVVVAPVAPPPVAPVAPPPVAPAPEPPKMEPVPIPIPMDKGLGEGVKVADADGFMPPEFPPLEEVVKGWMEIPKSAFPRPVKLMKGVEFVMVVNNNKIGSKVGPGGEATVISQDGTNLVVAPTPTSPAKTQISIDDTDLKASLTQAYDNWKVQRIAWLKRQFLFSKESANRAAETSKGGGAPVAAATTGPKPEKNGEGTYDILLTSMKTGQVTEITPQNAKKWGDVQLEKIDGKEYWTVIVDYTTKTMFGDFDTQAQARIFGGKVEKWIYTGSGEVVP